MKNQTDTQLAASLLERQQNSGRVLSVYLKRNAWRLPLFFCLIAFLLGFGIFAQSWGFCCFVFGLAVGIIGRDCVWLRYQRAVWPFYAKIIDWVKVEKAAKGEQLL